MEHLAAVARNQDLGGLAAAQEQHVAQQTCRIRVSFQLFVSLDVSTVCISCLQKNGTLQHSVMPWLQRVTIINPHTHR